MKLYEIIDNAIEELEDNLNDDIFESDAPHDTISEIADSAVPVYSSDLLQLAADNLELAITEPELGPAFDGEPTPTNIIAANIQETIERALWDKYQELKEAWDEKQGL